MGILNVTPDSFSDGGQFDHPTAALARAIDLQESGADILDIGAESTRPGSQGVDDETQISRLLPVLDAMRGQIRIPISIDTRSSNVADICLAAGASIINDVSGLRDDPSLADVIHKHGAGLTVMHMRGIPAMMQTDTVYNDLIADVSMELKLSVRKASESGIAKEFLLVDPGIGFGKSFEQNYELMGSLRRFQDIAAGVLAGPSRKGFTGEFNKLPAEQRQFSTAAAVSICILNGADAIRVHDVHEMRQVADICDRFKHFRNS